MDELSGPLAITGIGTVGPRGTSFPIFCHNYWQDRPPTVATRQVTFFGQEFAQKIYELPPLEDRALPASLRRRMSIFTKLVALSALECFTSSGLRQEDCHRSLGIVLGTGWGENETVHALLEQLLSNGEIILSPTLFHNSVHNAAVGYLGMLLQLQGPALTVSQAELSFEASLESALLLLAAGQCEAVLVGACDVFFDFAVLNPPVTEEQLPWSVAPLVSSGSAFVLVEPLFKAQARQARVYGQYRSLGSGHFANVGETTEATLAEQIMSTLASHKIGPETIGLVVMAGEACCQTIASALHEELLRALTQIFGPVPILASPQYPDRPTQGAEQWLSTLAILQERRLPTLASGRYLCGQPLSPWPGTRQVLLVAMTRSGFYRISCVAIKL